MPLVLCFAVHGFEPTPRQRSYSRRFHEPSFESFTPDEAIRSSRLRSSDPFQSPSLSILSHLADPELISPPRTRSNRRPSSRHQLPLEEPEVSHFPFNQEKEPSSRRPVFRNREVIRPSKPRFDFNDDFYQPDAEESAQPSIYTPEKSQNNLKRPIYTTTDDPYYNDYYEEDPRYDSVYDEEDLEKAIYNRPSKQRFRNRPLRNTRVIESDYYPYYPNEEYDDYQDEDYQLAPVVNTYPKETSTKYPKPTVKKEYPRAPVRKEIPRAPVPKDYPRAPVPKDYPRAPIPKDYPREPVVKSYPTRFPSTRRPSLEPYPKRVPVTTDFPRRNKKENKREKIYSEPPRSPRPRKVPQPSTRQPEVHKPKFTKRPFPSYVEESASFPSKKEPSKPLFTPEKTFVPQRVTPKRINTKKPAVTSFSPYQKKEKRQVYGGSGGHLDNNGLDVS